MMIEKIRQYFIDNNIIPEDFRINVDFLGEQPTEFALEPIAVNPILENYVTGDSLRQFQFQLLSCNDYSADVLQNMANSTFYEELYATIEKNNEKGILPKIEGIESIECLNNGAILSAETQTARYSIQMRVTYYKEKGESNG